MSTKPRASSRTSSLAAALTLSLLGGGALAQPKPASDFAPIEPLPSAPPPAAPRAPADVAEAPADATTTESGLAWKLLVKGKGGAHPAGYDRVTVTFTIWTPDGKVFDSTIPRGEPASLQLETLVKGWAEGLSLMTKGEKRRLWIPAALAYTDAAHRPGAPPSSAIVVDVELLDFLHITPPPPVPEDVEAAPHDAKRTASGIAYKILKHGKGKEHPKASSTVEVHYSGWTPEGKLFDSSVVRGKPTSFSLDGVIKGWTEGVQLLVAGDKARFWIPGKLAYGDKPARPGAPAGDLVFDIELLSIQ